MAKTSLVIPRDVYRRFVLGRTGLWPGRRFEGREGVKQAIRTAEFVQIDPISVVHRSHDIALWGRVAGYSPDMLNQVTYDERCFFDWGGNLQIHPMEQLPYWRVPMQRRTHHTRWKMLAADSASVIDEVRAALREKGPLGNRDFESSRFQFGTGYRVGKLTGFALYAMWLSGEVMTHSRQNFDRIYDFTENVAPKEHQWIAGEDEAEHYLARHSITAYGIPTAKEFRLWLSVMDGQTMKPAEGDKQLAALEKAGEIVRIEVEGIKGPFVMLTDDQPLLDDLLAGRIPEAWKPLGPTTSEEVTFLAPLEIVSARGRAAPLFDFDYIWEVYKPADKRQWGYYTLPILYGDRLVARLDPKLDRKTRTLQILGFWLEDHQRGDDTDFIAALGRGLAHFARFHEARAVDLAGIPDAKMRAEVQKAIGLY